MRGQGAQIKVHYKGEHDDYFVYVDSAKDVEEWKADKSKPLAQVVSKFAVYSNDKHGTQGQLGEASKGTLENEFNSKDVEDAIKKILEQGSIVEGDGVTKFGDTNTSNSGKVAH